MDDIRERLKRANKVDETKKKADKERIAELEQENAELLMAVVELADIIAGVSNRGSRICSYDKGREDDT